MKKTVFTLLVFSLIAMAFGQERMSIPKEYRDYAVKKVHTRPTDQVVDLGKKINPMVDPAYKNSDLYEDEVIGKTFYDLQTNSLLSNRAYYYPDDGTIGAVWTMGIDGPPSFPERGTGYNFYDGSAWGPIPTDPIESGTGIRTGWPSYAPLGANGEIVVAHDFANFELLFLKRDTKGQGNWDSWSFTSTDPPEVAWARMITAGSDRNTVHLLANTYNEYQGMTSGVVYSRSLDGGTTWDIETIMLDGMGPDYYNDISADSYVWAEPKDNTIAFLVADAWHDMFMMKSTDNGTTWEKTVIWEHPYPFFDWESTITDTLYCVDNSASIALDSEGKAHVVFGINRVLHDEVGTTYSYFPYVDGIGYWNEDQPTFSNDLHALDPFGHPDSELIMDENLIAYMWDMNENGELDYINYTIGDYSYRELGPVTMPTISINDHDQIVVLYSSLTEDYVWNDLTLFRHIWARGSNDGGDSWLDIFLDIDGSIIHSFDECIYPVATGYSDNEEWYVLYQADNYPGTALDEVHDYVENQMYFAKLHKFEVLGGEAPQTASSFNFNIYPNPVRDQFSLNMTDLPASVNEAEINITNLTGQSVLKQGFDKDGLRFSDQIDVSKLDAGIYFLTLKVNAREVTRKIIIE